VITTHTHGKFAPGSPNLAPNRESLDVNERAILCSGFFIFRERTLVPSEPNSRYEWKTQIRVLRKRKRKIRKKKQSNRLHTWKWIQKSSTFQCSVQKYREPQFKCLFLLSNFRSLTILLHETMDRNHLGRCTALSSGTECERYWEARTKIMEN